MISVLPPPMSTMMPSAWAMLAVAPMKSYAASSSPLMMRMETPVRRVISSLAARLLVAERSAAVAKAWTCAMPNVSINSIKPRKILTVFSIPSRTSRP